MKNRLIVLWVVFCSLGYSQKRILLVNDFEILGPIDKHEATVLSEQLRMRLSQSPKYSIVERQRLDAILKEQSLQLTDMVTPKSVVSIGKLVGADEIIIPTISKIGRSYILNMRSVDIETGIIKKAVGRNCKSCDIEKIMDEVVNAVVDDFTEQSDHLSDDSANQNAKDIIEPQITNYGMLSSALPRLVKDLNLYPRQALRAGIDGSVKIQLDISKTGIVKKYRIIEKSSDLFSEVAEKLVRGIVCEPAQRNGVAVDYTIVVPITFKLE